MRQIAIASVIIWATVLFSGCSSVRVRYEGGYFWTPIFEESSPDGATELTITHKCAFPAWSFEDPASWLRFETTDASSGKKIASKSRYFWKFSHIGNEPTVEWNNKGYLLINDWKSGKTKPLKLRTAQHKSGP